MSVRTIGKYEIKKRLAVGGMAEIFAATEKGIGGIERRVVIKRIHEHLAKETAVTKMLMQEARLLARLSHGNVVSVFDVGEDEGVPYLVLEYVNGCTLREVIDAATENGAPLPLDVIVDIVAQACAGAHAAHEMSDASGKSLGLVHRDISPKNIMIDESGVVKLLDFGIAKPEVSDTEPTLTGEIKGKLHYMSPEQCLQEPLGRQSDVFALGVVLFELCTLRNPFARASTMESMQAIVNPKRLDPRDFEPGLPLFIVNTISRALAVAPIKRWSTADAMRTALIEAADATGRQMHTRKTQSAIRELIKFKSDISGDITAV